MSVLNFTPDSFYNPSRVENLENLKKQIEKYLPAVLNETAQPEQSDTVVITEHTGDRAEATNNDENNDIVNIKRLAGLRS